MITIISTTNRNNSLTEKFAKYYSSILKSKNIETEILKLSNLPKDSLFSILYENNGQNIDFNKMKDIIKKSEKIVFIIPEYNGSFPGVLKVFIDALSWPSELKNKKCALIGISSGYQGCSVGLSHFTDILHYIEAIVLPMKLKFGGIKNTDLSYITKNENFLKDLDEQINKIIKF
ncbi:MAG: NAD(P)H-dependent oxidoreductase [Bacteroidetes bacterium]|nr:NAD(P)H-dependent oxidoreductase [Bacteroidota bacterium]